MRHLLLRLSLISIFLFTSLVALADEVNFRTEAPGIVARDEVFRIEF